MTKAKDQLINRLSEDAVASDFGKAFVESYFAQAFGSMPKSELDLLVFSLLMKTKMFTPSSSLYEIARALNVTPAKAKNLLFQHQLRTVDDDDLDHAVALQITTARFGIEGKKLTFGIESPIVRAAVQARAKTANVYLDISLSGEILAVQISQLPDFLAMVLTPSQQKRLVERLQKKGLVDKNGLSKALDAWSKKILEASAKEGGKQAAHALATHGFSFIGGALGFGGADLDFPIDLKDFN